MPRDLVNQYYFGGISISIYSEVDIAILKRQRFVSFLHTNANESNDIAIRYEHINKHSITKNKNQSTLTYQNSHSLTEIIADNIDCSLLRSNTVLKKLNESLTRTNQVHIEIKQHSVSILDFSTNKSFIFYDDISLPFIRNSLIGPTLVSLYFHDYNSLMIHCSCIDYKNKSAVFLAMDEGGKTTAVSLCEGGTVIADDQVLFKKDENEKWLAYGTPWTTFPPYLGSTTPKAFFLLEKSDKFNLTKLSSRELLAHLWHEHKKGRMMIPKMYHTKILDLYISLASSAPVYLMKFPKDYIDQEAILKCLDH